MRMFTFASLTGTALLLIAVPSLSADGNQPGDLWQTTSQMVMAGMPFQIPAQSLSLCVAKNKTPPPPSQRGQQCTTSNYVTAGNTTTWHMACSKPTMTGEGRITYANPGEYSGVITMASAEGAMTINITGKKTGGCDKPIN